MFTVSVIVVRAEEAKMKSPKFQGKLLINKGDRTKTNRTDGT